MSEMASPLEDLLNDYRDDIAKGVARRPQEYLDLLTGSGSEHSEDDGPGSRLGCQIKLTRALDGLVARTPVGQH